MSSYEQTMLKLEKMASANTAKQMTWQENMSNTSHQREVKDLVAAGLNPVLSSGGSGAQGYTTSVDSAVNGIAGMASARESANATRFAASQNAAATRYAAQMNYAAAMYSADNQFKMNQANIENSQWHTFNDPQGKLIGVIDKYLGKYGISDGSGVARDLTTTGTKLNKFFDNDPEAKQRFQERLQRDPVSAVYSLPKPGVKLVDNFLKKFDLAASDKNRGLVAQVLFGPAKLANRSMQGLARLLSIVFKNNSSSAMSYMNNFR